MLNYTCKIIPVIFHLVGEKQEIGWESALEKLDLPRGWGGAQAILAMS